MADNKFTIFYQDKGWIIRSYLFILFIIENQGKYKLTSQKNKLIVSTQFNNQAKLNLIRRLFVLMNFLGIKKVTTNF